MLPRLAYIGGVEVEPTLSGCALLYRLLQQYDPQKLFVLQKQHSTPVRRLADVSYDQLTLRGDRLLRTRLHRWTRGLTMLAAEFNISTIRRKLEYFCPEAVLTVLHNDEWLAAAEFASKESLPLHLIVHDDWPTIAPLARPLKKWLNRQVGKVYRQAKSRLCVSPYMEQEYRVRYGATGQVLYPSRAESCPKFNDEPSTYRRQTGPLVGAYAGSLYFGYSTMIREMAACLERQGGNLLLFGPHSMKTLRSLSLVSSNVLPQGLLRSEELITYLRGQADFLFVPMSFDENEIANVRLSFPSKLTDYTATGLPMLIWGPPYSSAVRWAQDCAPVAEVVTSSDSNGLKSALDRLRDAKHRGQLGIAASRVGERMFSSPACQKIFHEALQVIELGTCTS